jgi:glycolate oxidase FAD binding subunit
VRATADTLLRVSALPTHVGAILEMLASQSAALQWHLAGRALQGVLIVSLSGDAFAVCGVVATLRQLTAAASGHVAVLMAPAEVTERTSVWDDAAGASAVMRAVKAQFDPHGTLCPGGGPGGLA